MCTRGWFSDELVDADAFIYFILFVGCGKKELLYAMLLYNCLRKYWFECSLNTYIHVLFSVKGSGGEQGVSEVGGLVWDLKLYKEKEKD